MRRLALALVAATCAACGGGSGEPELFVFNWAEYFTPTTVSNFEKEFRCRVTVANYASGQELRAKIISGGGAYDVIFPGDDDLPQLVAADALEPLDPAKLPNLANLDEKFRRNVKHAVPFMWGTTGIAYNTEKIKDPIDSWAALWNPKYGPASMLEDPREVFGAALRLDGRSANDVTPESLERAVQRLVEQKKHLQEYNSAPIDALITGQVAICQVYSGDALQAATEAPVAYVIPKEGGTIWVDSMSIPKNARNKDLAYRFIDYLLRPEVSAEIANYRRYADPNLAAHKFIDPALLRNPIVYPSEEALKRCERILDLGKARPLLESAWAEVRRK